ncbi:MAG: hypothetical protein JWR58_5265 [Pseudonocardia sp.]|nr:hypothetical protein [Pseudonocardia sp.]
MDPCARPSGHRYGSSRTVSVAELIIRCSGREPGFRSEADRGSTGAISVATLLRREGRGPHAADPPLQPRGHSRPLTRPAPFRRSMRKATAAAGVLFAAGAVFSSAVVDTVVRSPNRNADLGVVPHGPAASGGAVDRTREVGDAPSADGVELTVVAGLFIPIQRGGADPDATARGLPSGPDGGAERSSRSTTSEVLDLAEGPATAPDDTDVMRPGDAGSTLTVLLPDVRIPVIQVQTDVELDVPIVDTISTPRFAVSEGRFTIADLADSASHGTVGVGVSESPEVEFSEVGVRTAQPACTGELLGSPARNQVSTL